MNKKIVIAIDGHSSCGKSTMAKDLAKEIGYIYVDTGAMYRCVTLFCMENDLYNGDQPDEVRLKELLPKLKISFQLDIETKRPRALLNGVDVEDRIRQIDVSSHVSPIAAISFVREALVAQQQVMGKGKGIVMDGRDIGTVVFPEAELKIFLTASAEVRAKRRYDELRAKGDSVSFEEILKNVQERDYIDSHRAASPLRKADDALLLDNSNLTIPEQQEWLMKEYKRVIAQ